MNKIVIFLLLFSFNSFGQITTAGDNFYELKRQQLKQSQRIKDGGNGFIEIRSNPVGIDFELNTDIVGKTDYLKEVPPGKYLLVLKLSEKEKIIENFEVLAGGETILHFDLWKMLVRKIEVSYGVSDLLTKKDVQLILKIQRHYTKKKLKVLKRAKEKRLALKAKYDKEVKSARGKKKDLLLEKYSRNVRKYEILYGKFLKKIEQTQLKKSRLVILRAQKRNVKENKAVFSKSNYKPYISIGARFGGAHATIISGVAPFTTSIEGEAGLKFFATGFSFGINYGQVSILEGASGTISYKRKTVLGTIKKDTNLFESFLSPETADNFVFGLQSYFGTANYEANGGATSQSVPYITFGSYITAWNVIRMGAAIESTLGTLPLPFAEDAYIVGVSFTLQVGYKF